MAEAVVRNVGKGSTSTVEQEIRFVRFALSNLGRAQGMACDRRLRIDLASRATENLINLRRSSLPGKTRRKISRRYGILRGRCRVERGYLWAEVSRVSQSRAERGGLSYCGCKRYSCTVHCRWTIPSWIRSCAVSWQAVPGSRLPPPA